MAQTEQVYDFVGEIIHETELASLFLIDDEEFWIPKSVYQDNRDGSYTVPEKWAIKEEMV